MSGTPHEHIPSTWEEGTWEVAPSHQSDTNVDDTTHQEGPDSDGCTRCAQDWPHVQYILSILRAIGHFTYRYAGRHPTKLCTKRDIMVTNSKHQRIAIISVQLTGDPALKIHYGRSENTEFIHRIPYNPINYEDQVALFRTAVSYLRNFEERSHRSITPSTHKS